LNASDFEGKFMLKLAGEEVSFNLAEGQVEKLYEAIDKK
jgi:hypothetical protein